MNLVTRSLTVRRRDDLLPCPFCGNTDTLWEQTRREEGEWSGLREHYWIECDRCDVQGPSYMEGADGQDHIEQWNRRPSEPIND